MGVQMQLVGLGLSLMAAQQQKKAYELEAQQYREQAKTAKLQADQQELERNRKLRSQLAALGTSMSAQGVALGTSPSVAALALDEEKIAKQDIKSIRLMGMTNQRKYLISASGAEAAGKSRYYASLGGFAKSVYSIENPSYTQT